MSRAGVANYRHPAEHRSVMMWDGFFREGVGREQGDHPYHPWNINRVPKPTYLGARTTSNVLYLLIPCADSLESLS